MLIKSDLIQMSVAAEQTAAVFAGTWLNVLGWAVILLVAASSPLEHGQLRGPRWSGVEGISLSCGPARSGSAHRHDQSVSVCSTVAAVPVGVP